MKTTDNKKLIMVMVFATILAILVNVAAGIVRNNVMDNYIERLETAMQQTGETLEIQKLSEYKGQMVAIRDCYLEEFSSPEYAMAKAKTVIKTIDADHTGFANDIEVSLSIHWEQFPEEVGNPIVIINTTINQIDDLIDEVKAG